MHIQQIFVWKRLIFLFSWFNVCESFSSWDNPFTQPGIIAGIIVGIIGLLVIVGVTIILCKFFCCKDNACCSCCCCCLEERGSTDFLSNIIPPKNKDSPSSNNELNNTLNNSNINNSHSHRSSPDTDDDYSARVSSSNTNLQRNRSGENVHNVLAGSSVRNSEERSSRDKNLNSTGGSNNDSGCYKIGRNSPFRVSSSSKSSFSKHTSKLSKKWSPGRGSRNPFSFIRGSSPRSSKGKRLPEYDDLPQFNWSPAGDPQALSYSASFSGADYLPPIYGLKDKKRGITPTNEEGAASVSQAGSGIVLQRAEYFNTAYDTNNDIDHTVQGEDSDADEAMATEMTSVNSQAEMRPEDFTQCSSASAGQFAYQNYNFVASEDDPQPLSARTWEMSSRAVNNSGLMQQDTLNDEEDIHWDPSRIKPRMQETDLDNPCVSTVSAKQWGIAATPSKMKSSTRDLTSHMQSQLSSQDDGHTILWGNLSQKATSSQSLSYIREVYQPYNTREAYNHTYGELTFQPRDNGELTQDRMSNPHYKPLRTNLPGSGVNVQSPDQSYSFQDNFKSRDRGRDKYSQDGYHYTSSLGMDASGFNTSWPKATVQKPDLEYGGSGGDGGRDESANGSRGRSQRQHSWQTDNISLSFGLVQSDASTSRKNPKQLETSVETEV